MKITKRQLRRIIREEKQKLQELDFSGPATQSDADVKLQDDVVAILAIEVLGYQPEEVEKEDELYEAAQKIIELCKAAIDANFIN